MDANKKDGFQTVALMHRVFMLEQCCREYFMICLFLKLFLSAKHVRVTVSLGLMLGVMQCLIL